MEINNFENIKQLLHWDDEADFYFVQILKRRKENPDQKKDVKQVRSFYINDVKEYDEFQPKIINLCRENNARAYIAINVRNYRKLALKMISGLAQTADEYSHGAFKNLPNLFDSVAGKYNHDSIRKWVIDVDFKDEGLLIKYLTILHDLQEQAKFIPYLYKIPTINGFHLITRPFDKNKFKKLSSSIDEITILDTDNTLLYYSDI